MWLFFTHSNHLIFQNASAVCNNALKFGAYINQPRETSPRNLVNNSFVWKKLAFTCLKSKMQVIKLEVSRTLFVTKQIEVSFFNMLEQSLQNTG